MSELENPFKKQIFFAAAKPLSGPPLNLSKIEDQARYDFNFGRGEKIEITNRGLRANPDTDTEGYIDILPRIGQQDLHSWLTEQYNKKQQKTICDIGFGQGVFLMDIAKEFKGFFTLIAYGSTYTAENMTRDALGFDYQPTLPSMKRLGIQVIEGNAIDIQDRIPHGSVDVITMAHSLGHIDYPRHLLFPRMISALRPQGQILIGDSEEPFKNPGINGTYEEAEKSLRPLSYHLELGQQNYFRPNDNGRIARIAYTTKISPLK